MPTFSREETFTVPPEGIALPVSGCTLMGDVYRGPITELNGQPLQVTLLVGQWAASKKGLDKVGGPFSRRSGGRLDITADYQTGSIREDRSEGDDVR